MKSVRLNLERIRANKNFISVTVWETAVDHVSINENFAYFVEKCNIGCKIEELRSTIDDQVKLLEFEFKN